ncbi:MAG: tetratricopeptide repeat protein [Rickettsiales bacterium]|nr:tetratricopeptide repeat protein [Rickettsiales bacterium]
MRALFISVVAVYTLCGSMCCYGAFAENVTQDTIKAQNQTSADTANLMKNTEIITIPANENNVTNNNIMGLPENNTSSLNQNIITDDIYDQNSQIQKENNNQLTDKQINDFRKEMKGYDEIYSKNVKVGSINSGGNKKIDIKVKSAKDSKEGLSGIDIRKAYDCFVNKQYELAIMYYKKALKNNNGNNEAKFGLATTYYMLMQYDQAIEIYSDLIINRYAREKVVNNLLFALQHKAYKDALDVLLYINDNSKGYSDILAQIGLIYVHLGDTNKALSALNRANELAPSNALVSYNLGIVYDKQNNYDYAKHFYEQAVRNDISEVISVKDFKSLSKRIEQLNEIIKKEVDKLVKANKKD